MASEPPRPLWLPKEGPGNLSVPPEQWGMTLRQWAAFIISCQLCKEKWSELEGCTFRKEAGYVNLYQICDHYVKPWTRNTGNSVALLLNKDKPLKAEVMISHAWGECILEAMVAVLGRASVLGMSLDTVIWFCTFAQYQPGDMEGDCGPGVAAQLALDPFKRVIESRPRYGMVVIHTSRTELYNRLWCVYEVNESEASGVIANAAVSMNYLMKLHADNPGEEFIKERLKVDCENASCFSESDAKMIKGLILQAGGFEKLNAKIEGFRASALGRMLGTASAIAEWSEKVSCDEPGGAVSVLFTTVRGAAIFVALHCLTTLAADVMDDDYGLQVCQYALQAIEDMTEKFFELGDLPPQFRKNKLRDVEIELPEDPEEVVPLLLDLNKFPVPLLLLDLGSGGNIMSEAIDEQGGLDESKTKLKEIFRAWDSDGNGKISEEELSCVIMRMNPAFTKHDCTTMFRVSDKNQDGFVDYDEFIEWLLQDFST